MVDYSVSFPSLSSLVGDVGAHKTWTNWGFELGFGAQAWKLISVGPFADTKMTFKTNLCTSWILAKFK